MQRIYMEALQFAADRWIVSEACEHMPYANMKGGLMGSHFTVATALLVVGLAPVAAEARFVGQTLQWQYYAYGGAYTEGTSSGAFTVAPTKTVDGQFAAAGMTYFDIITAPGAIIISYAPVTKNKFWSNSALSLAPTIYNGVAFNLTSPGSFTSVAIDKQTNMKGFDASHLSFTGSQIQIDWQHLRYTNATMIKLDVKVTGTAANARPVVRAVAHQQAHQEGSNPP